MTFRDSTGDYRIEELWKLSEQLPTHDIHIAYLIRNLDETDWPTDSDSLIYLSVRDIFKELYKYNEHEERIQHADLTYPLLISPTYDVYDGMHRLCKYILEKKRVVKCKVVPPDILQLAKITDLQDTAMETT